MDAMFDTSFLNHSNGYDFRTLPAELRNRIYEHVVVENDRISLNQQPCRPGITQLCTQTRQECLPIYFGRNEFSFTVANMDYQLLSEWFETLSRENVLGLRCLHILCAGRVLHDNYQPSFSRWDVLVTDLYSEKLKASQLRWKAQFRSTLWLNSTSARWQARHEDTGEEKCLFLRYVLTPLLKANGLLDLAHAPEEVQINQLLPLDPSHRLYVDSIESMPDLAIPKPLDRLPLQLYIDQPRWWYDKYLQTLQCALEQCNGAVVDAQDNLKAWQMRYGHMLPIRSFDKENYYRDQRGQLGRRADFDRDQWRAVKDAQTMAENKVYGYCFYGKRLGKIEDEKEFELAEHELSDFATEDEADDADSAGDDDGNMGAGDDHEDSEYVGARGKPASVWTSLTTAGVGETKIYS